MKNAIKKIAAAAMAFTLLGTGSAVTKTINPKFDTAITANAAYCNHVIQRKYTSNWRPMEDWFGFYSGHEVWQYRRYEDICCRCGKKIKTGTYYRYRIPHWLTGKLGNWIYTYEWPSHHFIEVS